MDNFDSYYLGSYVLDNNKTVLYDISHSTVTVSSRKGAQLHSYTHIDGYDS